jgi:hypothetical protein
MPLLRKDAVFRGSDIIAADGGRIFEGDALRAANGLAVYFVMFRSGFELRDQNGRSRPLEDAGPVSHLGHWAALRGEIPIPQWLDSRFAAPKYGKIRYMDFKRGVPFHLFDIVSVSGEYALIARGGGMVAALRDVGQFSGVNALSGHGYYYGQQIKDIGSVTLRAGVPGVLTADGFKHFGDAELTENSRICKIGKSGLDC